MTSPLKVAATAPVIKVNGQAMPEAALGMLVSLRVRRGLRIPGRAELTFDDPGLEVSSGSTFALGTEVKVTMNDDTVLFSGEVTGVDLELDRGIPSFTATVDDLSYRLTLGRKIRTFTQVTISNVVQKMAQEHGLQAMVDATTQQFEHLTQADSDAGFLSELADRLGYDWWVEDRKLYFKKVVESAPVVELRQGETLVQFGVRATALHNGEITTAGWEPARKQAVQGKSARTSALPTATLVQTFLNPAALKSVSKVKAATGNPGQQAEADALAAAERAGEQQGSVHARGTCRAEPKIVPGCAVSVIEAGPATGTYFVTEVTHTYSDRGFLTKFVAGSRRPAGLVDRLGPPATGSMRTEGLVVGVVTNNKSDPVGQVKVKFPGIDDTVESAWARVISMGGGAQRGIMFLPEINDEVIVGFEAGNVRRPVVLGGVHNGTDASPVVALAQGKVQTRVITSRDGHSFAMGDGDQPAEKFIGLTLANGHVLKLAQDKLTASVKAGMPVEITAGATKIEIGADGSITLSGKKITLKADTDIELSAMNVSVKSQVKAEMTGTQVALKANATLDLSSGGPTMVKGAIVKIN